jgi:hypothetical protein
MLECPGCKAPALRIRVELELGNDGNSDEVSIQAMRCTHCGFSAAASYEESRRGRLDSECWNHIAIRITSDDYAKLVASLAACPNRRNAECPCNAHRWFGQRSELGSLQPLQFVPACEGSGFTPKVAP